MNSSRSHGHGPDLAPNTERLSHERLIVYQRACEFLALAMELITRMPKGQSALADQLKRASLSVSLNIAEGAGKTTRADAAKSFAIARGSALECGSILDACKIMQLIEEEHFYCGKKLLVAEVAMLTKLCRRQSPTSTSKFN